MTEVYLALGSNVGDSSGNIAQAIKLLGASITQIKQAPLYRSKAVGVTDQPDFINTAVSGQTDLKPLQLLDEIKAIEQKLGRIERERWGPREIDIDIIFYGNTVLETGNLILPHPSFRERDFVLQPLVDLNPAFVDPLSHQSIKKLLNSLDPAIKSIIQTDKG